MRQVYIECCSPDYDTDTGYPETDVIIRNDTCNTGSHGAVDNHTNQDGCEYVEFAAFMQQVDKERVNEKVHQSQDIENTYLFIE
jgi:hypothetical protein